MNIWVTLFVLFNISNLCLLQFFHSFNPSRLSLFYPLRFRSKSEKGTTQPPSDNRKIYAYLPARRFDEKVKNLKYIDRRKRSLDNSSLLFGNVNITLAGAKKRPIKRIGIIHIKDSKKNVYKYNLPNDIDFNDAPPIYDDIKDIYPFEESEGLRIPRKAVKITGETRIKINNQNEQKKDDEGAFDKVFSYSFDTQNSKEENFRSRPILNSHVNKTHNGLKFNDILPDPKYFPGSLSDGTGLENYEERNKRKNKPRVSQTLENTDQEISSDARHHSSYSSSSQQPSQSATTPNDFMLNLSQSYLRLKPRQYNVSALRDNKDYYYPNYDKESHERGSISSYRSNHLDNDFKPSFPDFSEYIPPSVSLNMKPPTKLPEKQHIDHYRDFEEEIIKSDLIKESAKRIKDGTWLKPNTRNFTEPKIPQEESMSVRNHNIFIVSPPKQSKVATTTVDTKTINLNTHRDRDKDSDWNKHSWPESTTQYPLENIRTRQPRRRNRYEEILLPPRERPFDVGPLVIYDIDSKERNNQIYNLNEDQRHKKNEPNIRSKEELNNLEISKGYQGVSSNPNSYKNVRNPRPEINTKSFHNNPLVRHKDSEDNYKAFNKEEADIYKPRYNTQDHLSSFQNRETDFNDSLANKHINDHRYSRYQSYDDSYEKDYNFDHNNYKKKRYKLSEPSAYSYKVYHDSLHHSSEDLPHDYYYSKMNDYQKQNLRENHRNNYHRIMDNKFKPVHHTEKSRKQYHYKSDDYDNFNHFNRFRKLKDNDNDNNSPSVYRYNRKRPRKHRKISYYNDHYNDMRIRPDYRQSDDNYNVNSNNDHNTLDHYDPYFEEMRDFNDYLYRKTKDFQNHHYYQKMKEYYDDEHISDHYHSSVTDLPSKQRLSKADYLQPVREVSLYELPPPPLVPPPILKNITEAEKSIPYPEFNYAQSSYVKVFSDEVSEGKTSRYQNFNRDRPAFHRKSREENTKFPDYGFDINENFSDFPKFGYFKREAELEQREE